MTSPPDILVKILNRKLEEILERNTKVSVRELSERAQDRRVAL